MFQFYEHLAAIKRMHWSQIYYRFQKILKYRCLYKIRIPNCYRVFVPEAVTAFHPLYFISAKSYKKAMSNEKDLIATILAEADRLFEGEFCILNEVAMIPETEFPRIAVQKDKLWLYTLHAFDFGLVLLKAGILQKEKKYLEYLILLMEGWVAKVKPVEAIAWDPYPLSRRLVNWLVILSILQELSYISKQRLEALQNSLFLQTRFLANNMELDLLNNHVTANAKALLFSGLAFYDSKEGKTWVSRGASVLQHRMTQEILADGMQEERAPSYHLLTLQDYVELYLLLAGEENVAIKDSANMPMETWQQEHRMGELYALSLHQVLLPLQSLLTKRLPQMFTVLQVLMRPDRSLPLLNDSVRGYPSCHPDSLMAVGAVLCENSVFKFSSERGSLENLYWYMGEKGKRKFSEIKCSMPEYNATNLPFAGYTVMRSGWRQSDTWLIFDCGDLGPSYCPGHGHADALSFELFGGGLPLLVDPGVFSYHVPKERDYFRSTSAHNTVTVDGKNQSSLLGAFRIGSMAQACQLSWHSSKTKDAIMGRHNGYAPILHTRKLIFIKPNRLRIEDEISGKGLHQISLNFQLGHPVQQVISKSQYCLCDFGKVKLQIHFQKTYLSEILQIRESPISLEWNKKLPAKKIVYTLRERLPLRVVTEMLIIVEGEVAP